MNPVGQFDPDDWDGHWAAYYTTFARNPAHQIRYRLVTDLLQSAGPVDRLLDMGCGSGDLLATAETSLGGTQLVGIDVSSGAIDLARIKVPSARLFIRDGGIAPPDEFVGWATHATCCEVLEHLDDPVTFLRQMASYLGPGARVVITVPGGPMSALDRSHGHRQHYTPRQLIDLVDSAGMSIIEVGRYGFPMHNIWSLMKFIRGRRLIADINRNLERESLLSRLILQFLKFGFRGSTGKSRFGVQVYAVAMSA